jgi:hypothetical protein
MKRMIMDRRMMLAGVGTVVAGSLLSNRAVAGSLEPPGPPGPTGKTTDQLAGMIARPNGVSEPRTPVAGLPSGATSRYVISAPGSYCLTENIIGLPAVNGIQIDSDNVDLDLQGFHMTADPGMPGASTVAILVSGGQNQCIYNGTIEGWSIGVDVHNASKFLLWDVTVIGASDTGFKLGHDGQGYDLDVYSCPIGFDAPGLRTIIEECGAWLCPIAIQCNGSQNLIIGNCATGSPVGPFMIGQGNSYGPIVVVTGVGNIAAVAGSNHPLANFVF